jgi:hypothetical protein
MSKKCGCLITLLVFSFVSVFSQTSKKPVVKSKNTKVQNSERKDTKKNNNWKLLSDMSGDDAWEMLNGRGVLKNIYFRTDRVQRKGSMVEYWMKTDYFYPPSSGTENYNQMVQWQGDCINKKSRVIYAVEYYENGKVKTEGASIKSDEFSPVIPDSVGDAMLNLACSTKLNK